MKRLAIIGSGERAARHEAACRQVNGINVTVVAGTDDTDLLGRADIDAVDVCAPPGRAGEIAGAAARAGKQVLVEYLPGESEEAADRLLAECRRAGAGLHQLRPERRQPLVRDLKATVEAGKLGPLRYAHAASIWSASETPAAADDGPFLIEHATGTLDVLRWFFDVPVAKVFARSCPLEEEDAPSRYVSVVLFFADASQAICEVGLTTSFAPNTGLQRLALTGLRGSAYFNERSADVMLGAAGVRPLVDDPVAGLAEAFAAWAGADAQDDEDGRATLRLVMAAAASLRTGQPVEVRA
jgi:predicted dehydrogenase